jgi:D-beta-D-heptose 7-phosphate kinase/D-beta-D-heptose 1-phosphate adenosyltransferase
MKTIVTCNGCFNGLHHGHLFFLGFARGQGDELIVGINGDDYIRRKKKYEPIPQDKRVKMLMELVFVSRVIIFDENDPCEFIRTIRPDIHCIGEEYGMNCVEWPLCQELGVRVSLIPRVGKWSTRAILNGEIAGEGIVKSPSSA